MQNYISETLGERFVVDKPQICVSAPIARATKLGFSSVKKLPERDKEFGVGKRIGGKIYVHQSAEDALSKKGINLESIKKNLPENFSYTYVSYNLDNGNCTFTQSPDWDVNPEPIVGNAILVKSDGSGPREIKPPGDPWIIHHKHLFVKPDYHGTKESEERSNSWYFLEGIDKSRIGKKSYWQQNVLPLIETVKQHNKPRGS